MCAFGGAQVQCIAFLSGRYTRKQHPWVSTILWYQEHDLAPFFRAVFLKMVAQSQKRRIAAVSSWPLSPGLIKRSGRIRVHGKKLAAQTKAPSSRAHTWIDSSFLDYRSPVWNADGARAEKIGRRSSTALHVWSGRADASSSDVP